MIKKVIWIKRALWIIAGLLFIWDVGMGSLLFLLPRYGYNHFFIEGESMVPVLNPGDLVIIKTSPKEIRPGMIIAYYPKENEAIIHRVISIEGDKLITKGDVNTCTDQEVFGYIVKISDVRGVYLFKIPKLGCFLKEKK